MNRTIAGTYPSVKLACELLRSSHYSPLITPAPRRFHARVWLNDNPPTNWPRAVSLTVSPHYPHAVTIREETIKEEPGTETPTEPLTDSPPN